MKTVAASPRQDAIIAQLTDRIVSGRVRPGDRLPSRADLSDQLGVSLVTVQRALERMAEDGLVEARGRAGTRVCERPPHVYHYGIVFPESRRPDRPWSRFYQALAQAAEAETADSPYTFGSYYGLAEPRTLPAFHQLTADIEAGKFAGLIFPFTPFAYAGTPILETPNMPRVALMEAPTERCGAVCMSHALAHPLLIAALKQARRRRLAIMSNNTTNLLTESSRHFQRAMAEAEMQCPRCWRLPIPFPHFEAAECWTELLFRGDDRPEALIIEDDNFVPVVTRTMRRLGVRSPEDCLVIAHTNFPSPSPCAVPAIRYGWHIDEMVRLAIDEIHSQRQGKPPGIRLLTPTIDREPRAPTA